MPERHSEIDSRKHTRLKGTDASGKEIIVYVSERHLVSIAPTLSGRYVTRCLADTYHITSFPEAPHVFQTRCASGYQSPDALPGILTVSELLVYLRF